jgi:hypothetical protein
VTYRVNDLNLDEIFAAYVAGKVDEGVRAGVAVGEMTPQR